MNTTCINNCHHTNGVILGIQNISQHLKVNYCNYQSIDFNRPKKNKYAEIPFDKIHCPFIEKLLLNRNRNLFNLTGNIYTSKVPPASCNIFIVENFKLSHEDWGQARYYLSSLFFNIALEVQTNALR